MTPGLRRAVDRIEIAAQLVATEQRAATGPEYLLLGMARAQLESALLMIDDACRREVA